ncbi:MAG: mechanosensitive ion channel [Phycisphaerae bacterium]|nr:mechanosensitive ion channel family protein [Phycisphaerae bacterium]NIP52485.1 mechanosensitive ion channel family protein [Phycisphaerae bacterium]NIS51478.1 mechanosensitive ion channel family protein [Phycisphaerae bacterium]NIU08005.1 mechanosensitive ion channel family protein [Phycisphaerae bacterium]NIU56750.1 mechanosensitive ion channel [Phycisphaerae bacterium]
MTASALTIIASGAWWQRTIGYKIMGNEIWRFLLILAVVMVAMAAGKIIQFAINTFTTRRNKKRGITVLTLFLRCLTKPISVALLALGLFVCKAFLIFDDKEAISKEAISFEVGVYWTKITQALAALALAYALFRLVDVIEHYLQRWIGMTKTKLDDMLVPVIRKSLRATIAIIAALWIADGILDAEIRAILVSAGVGGIAIALAAKDTIANFFGSVTIFADRPFQIDELIKIGDHLGPVEQVGFRSTKIRTREGHLVTVPNSIIANSMVENIARRPYIRRISNLTITYDSGQQGAERAVQIIKEVLSDVPEVNIDPEKPFRVYFSEFNDWSLNIYMSYWVKPPDYWLYHEVNERVNMEIMKRFEAEKIEFAFPSQTLYIEKN